MGSYLCASNVTSTDVRFLVSVVLCFVFHTNDMFANDYNVVCTRVHFRNKRPKKHLCFISKDQPILISVRSTGASLLIITANIVDLFFFLICQYQLNDTNALH